MSAIRCKILLCSNEAKMVSSCSAKLTKDIADNPELAKTIVKTQERYIKEMNAHLGVLTSD